MTRNARQDWFDQGELQHNEHGQVRITNGTETTRWFDSTTAARQAWKDLFDAR